ncbi:substrate-binding domain-containing protein [Actinomadura roseirufa]|uniref:substrate-binding domain-containing protein n=1 Tax=Actinomadura roseirufa TaxID=2094049 RepID=UPI001041A325|nr:substrate-binding domain-containing protein [Actinomadura roseirufa]
MTTPPPPGFGRATARRRAAPLRLALVVPLQGPAGIFGPSCRACAQLAAEECNRGGGVLGREVRLTLVDGGAPPGRVAREVAALVARGEVDGVTGWHLSSVRKAIAPHVAGRVPYVYAPLYEGGEHTPGVFLAGETPGRQILPGLRWLARERGVRRWCIVGDDYVWPRATAEAARRFVRAVDGTVRDEFFLPLGTEDFERPVRRVERSGADAVLMLLVGQDAVGFNRAFARSGLDGRVLRFSPLMEENMLMAGSADDTRGLYAAAGYFACLPTAGNLDFNALYVRRFGPDGPMLNSLGESCYESIMLFGALARRAGGLDPAAFCRVADDVGYDGPRGAVHLRDRHLRQQIYLAEARGLEFEVVTRL